ncbi:cuticle protein 7-like [Procambarus clarkii]|uniref:cuticle protein 7-like n=1 Tax=Procambarus clarkii TaxID=6728 RepID=UPI001E678898|nr:cuticle protein 7-like [Procambarus clarkii]
MNTMKVIVVLSLVAAALAAPSRLQAFPGPVPAPYYRPVPAYKPLPLLKVPARYNFGYSVNDDYSGNNFGHQETRDGYDTKGSYSVQLPDGRVQQVTYTVNGDSGYVAEVTYYGEAKYPAYRPAPAYTPVPAYRPTPLYG